MLVECFDHCKSFDGFTALCVLIRPTLTPSALPVEGNRTRIEAAYFQFRFVMVEANSSFDLVHELRTDPLSLVPGIEMNRVKVVPLDMEHAEKRALIIHHNKLAPFVLRIVSGRIR